MLLQVLNVSGEFSLQGVIVSLDGVDEVAEVPLEVLPLIPKQRHTDTGDDNYN